MDGRGELLGREGMLSALDDALQSALRGRGNVVVVSGEAGLGKSSLIGEALTRGRALGFSLHTGRAWEYADAPPLFPLHGCLRALGIDPGFATDDGATFALWERTLSALSVQSEQAPVLWAIEDLHAADLQSLDLLSFLSQPLRSLRVLVVVSARMEDPRLVDRTLERLRRMARDGVDLRLEPLSFADTVALLQLVVSKPVPEELVRTLAERSAGNPLVAVEYGRALKASRRPTVLTTSLPHNVRDVVAERARWLPEKTREVLDVCAVVGREFSAVVVGAAMELLPARVIDLLLAALRSGLVEETEPGAFRFSHVLVQEALYEGIAPATRAHWHAAVAKSLASRQETLELLVTRAHHAVLGLSAGGLEGVEPLLERAVEALSASGAHDRAHRLQTRVDEARATGMLPSASVDQLLASAELARRAGRHQTCETLCHRVLAHGRAQGDATVIARGALALGASLRPGVVIAPLVAALQEAQESLPESEVALRCLVSARLAAALQPHPDPQVPIAMARESIAMTRETGDETLLRQVLVFAGSALVDYAPFDERMAAARELQALARAHGDLAQELLATIRLSMDRLVVGEMTELAKDVERALQLSSALGSPEHRWRPLLLQSMQAAMQGDFATAERAVVEVRELSSVCDDPALLLCLNAHVAMTWRLWRKDEEVRKLASTLEHDVFLHTPGLGPAIRGMMYARIEDAEATAREVALVEPHLPRLMVEPDLDCNVAEAIAMAGSDALRREIRERITSRPRRGVSMGHIPVCYDGPAARLVGLLDASLGDGEAALCHLREALAIAEHDHHAPFVAQTEYEIGKLLTTTGDTVAAADCFRRALAVAEQAGMDGLVAAARVRLDEDAPAEGSPEPVPARGAAMLTLDRDGDAWHLQREGRGLRLRDSRGVQLLARLLERPGEEIHVLVLASDGAAPLPESDAGDQLDEQARQSYRARLRELERDLEDARDAADLGRAERLEQERQMLVDELERAVGLGRRVRKAGSTTERARVNVQKRLREAIGRIEAHDPELGGYLAGAVRTGTYCCFRP